MDMDKERIRRRGRAIRDLFGRGDAPTKIKWEHDRWLARTGGVTDQACVWSGGKVIEQVHVPDDDLPWSGHERAAAVLMAVEQATTRRYRVVSWHITSTRQSVLVWVEPV